MITYPPALRRTGFGPPGAIRHFTAAIAEARAAQDDPRRVVPMPRPSSPVPAAGYAPLVPQAAPEHRTVIRLWLPATLLFVLLAPFAILLAPLLYFVPRVCPRPFASVFAIGRVLLAVSGVDVDVDTPEARVRIRLF
jgi:hypothetical protein